MKAQLNESIQCSMQLNVFKRPCIQCSMHSLLRCFQVNTSMQKALCVLWRRTPRWSAPLPLIMGRLGPGCAWSRVLFPPLALSARLLAPSSLASRGSRARCRLPSMSRCDLGGAVLCAVPSHGRWLLGASVGRRLPPCALAAVAAGCGMSGEWWRPGATGTGTV